MEEKDQYNKDLQTYTTTWKIAERLVELSASREPINSEETELIEFLRNEEKVNCLRKRLNNPFRANNYLNYLNSQNRDCDIDLLVQKMKHHKRETRLLLCKRISVAAVAAAVLFLSFLVSRENSVPVNNRNFFTEKLQYVSEGPTILFDNGESLDLAQNRNQIATLKENISLVGSRKVKYDGSRVAPEQSMKYNTIIVPSRYTWDLELSDGTVVTLNANSRLKFPVNFANEERVVELNGEAYFKVSKSSRPFIVKMGESMVQVYGTEFNINMNKQGMVQTVLVEGSIGFKSIKNEEVILKPNQMVTLYSNAGNLTVAEVDVRKYLGWRNALFFYEQEPLLTLLDDMASWYGVDFRIANPSIKDIDVTLTIRREIPLIELLSILETMLKVQFINDGQGKYTIN